MSIIYPLTPPSTPGVQSFKLSTVTTIGGNSSPFTGKQQVIEWPREFFQVQVGLPAMLEDDAEEWVSFLTSLRGTLGTFLMPIPNRKTARGVASGTPLVNGNQAAGSKTLATKGWTHSITGILKAGDYIQLGTGDSTHLHKNLKDVNSDSSGNATLDIFPRLRATVATNDAIVVSSAKGKFRLTSNQQDFTVDVAQIYGVSFEAVEALDA